ncbi:MAG: trypsin-like peptidase domain-containing protein [Bacteroidota bacterium]|nr:trypsin-like peptidase domain-containing protein [Bacteroidota bacterium]MDP4229209.1 trypsin-like peptidase domain-containing protein [Bacteroidota bacterium]MDP4235263.1 trypsin-like peptidase domain-containing protein [Bacteroidota bacterium]
MKSKNSFVRPVILIVFGLLFGVGMVAGFGGIAKLNIAFGQSDHVMLGGPTPNIPQSATLESINTSFKAVAKAIQPTIVSIKVKTEAPKIAKKDQDGNNPFKFFFHSPNGGDDEEDANPFSQPQGPSEGLGSGVIVTSDGYILTNNHVVENAAKKGGIIIKLTDKHEYEGHVVGTDPTTDIAVVKIEATGLPVAALGNSDDVSVGEWVLAVGNPLGLESTVTTGIVSSIGRYANIFDEARAKVPSGTSIANFIQTDAAINPGNSGGGLFNARGQVIGINAAIATRTGMFAGYGFAIPINLAKFVATDLIKMGHVNRGYIGVNIKAIDQTEAEALGLSVPRGVRIDNVVKGSAGEAAGLHEGDVILSVDGQETNESNQLQGLIALHHAGDNVSLKIWRSGKEIDKSVTLRPRSDVASNEDDKSEDSQRKGPAAEPMKETATMDNIGVTVRNLNTSEKDKYDTKGGVYITNVVPGSEAYDRGLGLIGKVVTAVDQKPVKNVDEFEKVMGNCKGRSIGVTVIDDKGDKRFVAIRVPKD